MGFVKLDCGMLDSTTWFDKDARDIFITALLMAVPKEFDEPMLQIEINSLKHTGWAVPAGWYGFVSAASTGIIARCGLDENDGMAALERLSAPESESRSQKNDGRRMVRVDGGFVILNYDDYREKDHTAAERQRRYRAKKKAKSNAVTLRDEASQTRNVTQAEAEAEASKDSVTTLLTKEPTIGGAKQEETAPPPAAGKDEEKNDCTRRRRCPPSWKMTDKGRQFAYDKGMIDSEIDVQEQLFRDHEYKTPRKDWHACWRTWCTNTKIYDDRDQRRETNNQRPDNSFDSMLARNKKRAGVD